MIHRGGRVCVCACLRVHMCILFIDLKATITPQHFPTIFLGGKRENPLKMSPVGSPESCYTYIYIYLYITLHHSATHRNTLQHTALQHTVIHCNKLQHTAKHCNPLFLFTPTRRFEIRNTWVYDTLDLPDFELGEIFSAHTRPHTLTFSHTHTPSGPAG